MNVQAPKVTKDDPTRSSAIGFFLNQRDLLSENNYYFLFIPQNVSIPSNI
jgi:hypothetical protein